MTFLISKADLDQFGCSQCGCFQGIIFGYIGNQATMWNCTSCFSITFVTDSSEKTLTPSLKDCKLAVANHPLKKRTSFKCCKADKVIELVDSDVYTVPCWINGGAATKRNAIVLKAYCPIKAKNIKSLLNDKCIIKNDIVIIGTDKEHSLHLYNLMWDVIKTKQINLKIINKYRNHA